MIELQEVSYAYPQAKGPALFKLSLSVPQGQFMAVTGPNGAGKTTLSYILSGFIPHHFQGTLRGRILVDGLDLPQSSMGQIAGRVGLVFSNPFNQISGARFTVQEEVAFGLENMGLPRAQMIQRVNEILDLTGLSDVARRSPYALSGGQQQRLALASMLVMQPRLLVLDEPTSQLDPSGKKDVFAVLDRLTSNQEMTVVLIEQELEWIATFADRVIVMDQGRIIADGSPQQILVDPKLIDLGLGNTNYTIAARGARQIGLIDHDQSLPVTLDQAEDYFKA